MEEGQEKAEDRDSAPEDGTAEDQRGDESSDEDGKDKKDSPGPPERTEDEKEKQREEDARAAQERLEEVRDAPPEEHPALKADAVGSTIILIGALFVVVGVIVAIAYSPWGWVGVVIGVVEIIVGQLFRRREIGSGESK